MEFNCYHCGNPFSIQPAQLGTAGRCPHCNEVIHLPKAGDDDREDDFEPASGSGWLSGSVSTLVSIVFHMLLFLLFALITFNYRGGQGIGEEVAIGELPSESLTTSKDDEFSSEEMVDKDTPEAEFEELEVAPPTSAADDAMAEISLEPLAPSGGDTGSFDLGAVSLGGAPGGGGGGWDGMIQTLRRDGLDVVIVFDSTGSMGGEIKVVKDQIKNIGSTLVTLVPKARIGLVTYRDEGESYVAKGLPLTGNIQNVDSYLAGIRANGGGDHPEAVHEGLRWAVSQNQFRSRAKKVILLFGDAPPHREHVQECLRIASDFHRGEQGIVSTVTCRQRIRLPEFVDIAQAGGGEAFLTSDQKQIMTQLMVLVFGSKYRGKVLEAFKLMGG